MNPTLRLTDTNPASDSSGRTWGLDGNLVWWLIGGLGAGITVFFVSLVVADSTLGVAAGLAAVPILLCLAYIFGLRQGRPPGFDRDLADLLLNGEGFTPGSPLSPPPPSHPLR